MSQGARKQTRSLDGLALAVGVVGLGAWVSLLVFFAVGGPFGFINDASNGALAVCSGALATAALRSTLFPGKGLIVATSLAVVGTIVAVLGSVLVILGITGYFLAGLVSGTGFAFIGLWLVAVNHAPAAVTALRLPTRYLTRLGVVAGAVMAFGFINVPGIVMGLDDMDAAPGWLLVGGAGWTGAYLLLPVWSIWLSRSGSSS
jgi:hypothetical protein